jgi:hypothetical protein
MSSGHAEDIQTTKASRIPPYRLRNMQSLQSWDILFPEHINYSSVIAYNLYDCLPLDKC